jgi:hypothetical protein
MSSKLCVRERKRPSTSTASWTESNPCPPRQEWPERRCFSSSTRKPRDLFSTAQKARNSTSAFLCSPRTFTFARPLPTRSTRQNSSRCCKPATSRRLSSAAYRVTFAWTAPPQSAGAGLSSRARIGRTFDCGQRSSLRGEDLGASEHHVGEQWKLCSEPSSGHKTLSGFQVGEWISSGIAQGLAVTVRLIGP